MFLKGKNAPMLSHWVLTTVKKYTSNLSGGILGLFSSTHLSYHHPGHPQRHHFCGSSLRRLRQVQQAAVSLKRFSEIGSSNWRRITYAAYACGEKFLGDLRRKLDKKWLFFYLPSESWIHDPGTWFKAWAVWAPKCPYSEESGEWNNSIL